jgi:pyruvate-ferredoxin/flavodoxin oxidoreductase
MSGVVQNQDAYMKGKIAQRFFADRAAGLVREAMSTYAAATGRSLAPVITHRMQGAEVAIVAMGSMAETAMATADWLRANSDLRVGVVQVVCYRPFPTEDIVQALGDVRAVAVMERMDDPLAQSNPLTTEIKAAFADALSDAPGLTRVNRVPRIHTGIAGLGSRDVRPGHLIAAVKCLYERGPQIFALGIDHELALESDIDPDVRPAGSFSMRGYSVGGFGSVTTNKVIANVTSDLFDLHVQAYPFYGSEKKGLPTRYFLTAAPEAIRTHCELLHVDFVPLNSLNALHLGNPLDGVLEGGRVFVQTTETDPEKVWELVPPYARRIIRERKLELHYLDAAGIAAGISSRADLRVRMQGIVLLGVFLRVTPFAAERGMDAAALMEAVESSVRRYFGKAGERVVQDNLTCVRRGFDEVLRVEPEIMEGTRRRRREITETRTVETFMTVGAVTCRPDTPLSEVRELLAEQSISCAVVVDGAGNIAGIVSTTDLEHAGRLADRLHWSPPQLLTSHVMSRLVLTTWPEEPLSDAVARLVVNRVHRLVVTPKDEPSRPLGILSVSDLVEHDEIFATRTDRGSTATAVLSKLRDLQ